MENLKSVSKEEFGEFIRQYPRPIETGTSTVADPPIRSYFDKSRPTEHKCGTFEYFCDVRIAAIRMEYMGPKNDVNWDGLYWDYYILDNTESK